MADKDRGRWEDFQTIMAFCDHLRGRGIWFCRRTSEQEQKHTSQFFTDLRFDDLEKTVRRYLLLPSKAEIETLLTKELEQIRKKHAEDRLRDALPGVVSDG